jgi:tetratricopeptide (TPR) repeat protein
VEDLAIQAHTCWLDDGNLNDSEAGQVVTELAILLLTHQRLLDVAQLVVRYGWMSLQSGHGPRLAHLAQERMELIDWHQTVEYECTGLVLLKMLFPSLGKPVETKGIVNYERIRDAFLMGKLVLHETIEGYVTHQLMLNLMNALHFNEAEALLDAYRHQLEARHVNPENSESWLQKRALLLGLWCEYLLETGETERSQAMREETIRLYQQRAQLLSPQPNHSPLKKKLRNRALGSCFSFLGDHLNRSGQHKEALRIIDKAIDLQKQRLGNIGVLASSYSDRSQILMELGRFQEALLVDEEAMVEIQRCIDAGDAISQRDVWTYYVNRGCLYLRVGRVEEAEHLFRNACPHIHENRRIYRMFARDGLNEIEQWRQQSVTSHYQLDWRWIERYRELCAYDNVWWLTWAGPFTEEEQAQWDELSALPLDEATKTQLGMLMKGSRERELAAALSDLREPSLHYPAIDIAEVQRRIAANVQLKEEIHHQEPNVIVRRLYEGVIEEELDYLHLIEASYEHDSQKFHEYSLRIFPLPTQEEMRFALTHIERTLAQGLKRADTANLSQQLLAFLQMDLHLELDLTSDEEVCLQRPQKSRSVQSQETSAISAQATKRFFEAVFQENGYEGWQVQIDINATNARVEQGMRCLGLPDKTYSLSSVKDLFTHEVAGHVARCVAGERSLLGLLGVQTQNHAPTEEGYILYHQRQLATLREEPWNDSGMRLSTLSIGLAQGIMTPPQTFLAICSFIEAFSLLRRLLKHPEIEREVHEKRARAFALNHCLRVFRGVPDLTQAGICYPQDAIYLHGLFMIERAVSFDKTVLDRLAVGKVALELLPDLQELGITTTSLPSLYTRASGLDLDAYILSFE